MFRVTLKGHGDPLEWSVWASLEEPTEEHPVEFLPESFILGSGSTPAEAKLAAHEALVDAGMQLLRMETSK